MNEKNFNSISQFEVPKSWIDGALAVPATHKKKPFPLIKLTRTLAAVACFVLVCGLSVALYFITDDSSIPPVKDPVVTENVFVDSSNNTGENDNNSQKTDNNENRDTNSAENPTSSGSHSEGSEDRTENGADSHPEPNEKPQKPTTNKPDKPDSSQPSEDVTNPYEPQQPTQPKPPYNPTENLTESPSEDFPPPWMPTEKPWNPKPPTDPTEPPWEDPTEAPTECPTEGPYLPPPTDEPTINENYNVYVRVDSSKLIGSKNAYCAFYDPNGNLVGEGDMFASYRIMEKGTSYDGKTPVFYYPYRMLDITVRGWYTYTFYNENGEVLHSSSTHLSAEK